MKGELSFAIGSSLSDSPLNFHMLGIMADEGRHLWLLIKSQPRATEPTLIYNDISIVTGASDIIHTDRYNYDNGGGSIAQAKGMYYNKVIQNEKLMSANNHMHISKTSYTGLSVTLLVFLIKAKP